MAKGIESRIGHRIRELRLVAGMSQAELAERLEPPVEPESVSRYERGARVPSLPQIEKLAGALGTDVDHFLAGLIGNSVDPVDRRELQAILDMLAPLSKEHLRAIRTLVAAHLEGVAVVVGENELP